MKFIFLISILIQISNYSYSSVRGNLSKGNSAYKKENYDIALAKYKQAEIKKPNLPETMFNLGNVYYKNGVYEDALKNYEKSTYSKDILLQSKAYYNMGNAMFRLGKLPEAIQLYKKALELNPDDKDAKFNIEFVQKRLKENIDKQLKQTSQNKNQQKQKERQEKQKKQEQQNEDKKQEEKKQGMLKEDADRLLESTGGEKRPKEKANIKMPLFRMPEKDW